MLTGFVWVSFLGVVSTIFGGFSSFQIEYGIFFFALSTKGGRGREMFIVAASYLSLLQAV